MTKEEMQKLAMRVNTKDKRKAQMIHLFPQMGNMSANALEKLGFNADAIKLTKEAAGMTAEELAAMPEMHGISSAHTLPGWTVVAKKAIERFFSQTAPLEAFSTTFSSEFVPPGSKQERAKLVVGLYDDSGEAEVDNFDDFDDRDSASSSHTTVELHKVDDVITIYARNLEKGIDPEKLMLASVSRVVKKAWALILSKLAIDTVQADDALTVDGGTGTKKIAAIEIPAIGNADGDFNFGYANQVLSEEIQPEVHAMLVDSAHYGALKAANKDSLTAGDLDIEFVKKVQSVEQLGANAKGLIANRRAAAVGFAAPLFLDDAYTSVEQLTNNGIGIPLTVATYYQPGKNAMKVVVATMVGVTVTDASAIKVLTHAPAAATEAA